MTTQEKIWSILNNPEYEDFGLLSLSEKEELCSNVMFIISNLCATKILSLEHKTNGNIVSLTRYKLKLSRDRKIPLKESMPLLFNPF